MASTSRLSTAAQFFEDDGGGSEAISTYDRVVDLVNKATLMRKEQDKVNNLKLVTELIVHKEPALLDNFLDEMLAFQSDRAPEVKKFIITFIEEACKKDPDVFSKVIGNLVMLLQDDNVAVSKKVMLSMSNLYRIALQWIAKAKSVSDGMEQTWHCIVDMKNKIIEMLDSDNDGVRTHAVKFMEGLVLCLSEKQSDSEIPKGKALDISLDVVPSEHPFFKYKKLEDEGKKSFERLTDFLSWHHISSVNLMTCMGVLTNSAKQRPQYMPRVIQAFEALHVNLPPTLAKSQVSSVRKNLKMQLLQLLKHPASVDNQTQVTTLLTDLGATQSEVFKNMPKIDESKKRKVIDEQSEPTISSSSKKAKVEIPLERDDDDYGATPFIGIGAPQPKKKPISAEVQKSSAIDITAEDLITRLTPQNVADLVLLSMVMLPDTMPPSFSATYTPIAAAGTDAQVQHLSRLLATQLTVAGLGKGVHEMQGKTKVEQEEEEDESASKQTSSISTVVGGKSKDDEIPKPVLPPPPKFTPPAKPPSRKGLKQFKLAAVTKPLDTSQVEKMALEAIKRILQAEKAAQLGNVQDVRTKIVAGLVCQFGGPLRGVVEKYIFEDLRNRADLALAWVYHEYANFQGYTSSTTQHEKPSVTAYDECLTKLLTGLLERPDQREGLFSRLLLEAPYITPNAIQVLRKYCQDETRIYLGMTTLKELIVKRPCLKLEFLDVLLDFTSHEKPEVRNNAIRVTKTLHEVPELTKPVERYALFYLKYLMLPTPPAELFDAGKGHGEPQENWTEETIKMCLYLYLGLLPVNHSLIHELANVYTTATADIKRTILRVLEVPVKGMGMHSPELLLLVENCPKGAETLVTRIIHILTDKNAPSPDLVRRVRDLYQKRVSDVRFLIPVLTGLSKPEVIAALPKLIKLNPVVVKEVFNRLLGVSATQQGHVSPLTPTELLVALHNIDPSKVDMKTIIKATNLCFGERNIYTLEILAAVMNQLVEQTPLPTLLMRTVIQSIAMYPKLLGYAMNIMQRLINKQVWKQKKVWEGFVKCCQRCKPQSYQVLLQLPAQQLKSAFEICPDLREPLLQHVQNLTPHQRAHIQKSIIMVLEKGPVEDKLVQEAAQKAKTEENEKLKAQEEAYQEKLEQERIRQQQGTDSEEATNLNPAVKIKEEPMDTDEGAVTLVKVKVENEEEEPMEIKSTTPRRSARNIKS